MNKPILYSDIQEKNAFDTEWPAALTPPQRLIHCLDLMDMMAKMRQAKITDHNEDKLVKWVVLNLTTA